MQDWNSFRQQLLRAHPEMCSSGNADNNWRMQSATLQKGNVKHNVCYICSTTSQDVVEPNMPLTRNKCICGIYGRAHPEMCSWTIRCRKVDIFQWTYYNPTAKLCQKRDVVNDDNITFFGPQFNWSWSSDIAVAELSLVFNDLQVLRCCPSSTIQASAVWSGNNTVRVAMHGWCFVNVASLHILHVTTFDSVGQTKEDVFLVPSPVMSSHCGLVHSYPPWQAPRRALYGLALEGSSV